MNNTFVLVDHVDDLKISGIKQRLYDSKIFSFDLTVHKILEQNKIVHELADRYISTEDRSKLFELSLTLADKWYKNIPLAKEFELNGVNLFGLFDTFEFQQYIVHIMIQFLTIKKILEKEIPSRIITTTNFSRIVKSISNGKNVVVETYDNNIPPPFLYEKIEIMLNLGRMPISLHIPRSTYLKIKNKIENVLGTMFNLWFNFDDNEKTVLFLEINPSSYTNLISNIRMTGTNIVFLNRRRPAIWNWSSIQTLRKYGCKLPNVEKILDIQEKNQVTVLKSQIFDKMKKMWFDDKTLERIFSLDGNSFWPVIRDIFVQIYEERMGEYIDLLMISKKLLKKANISCIFLLYEIGETEKAILDVNKNKIPTIIHQHGFDNLTKDLAKYDPLTIIPLKSNKITVYGQTHKDYLQKIQNISEDKILVSGSPRHDYFFGRKSLETSNKKQIVLVTPVPITEFTAQPNTDLYLKFENSVEKLWSVVKDIPNVQMIVKLHPSREFHNEEIKKLFKKLDPKIPIYQMTPILDLLDKCDVLVNIQPESYNTSTVIMEAFILNKPTMTIFLDNQYNDIEFVKDNASLITSKDSELEENIKSILFDEHVRKNLVSNGKKHLDKYLANHGVASEYLSKIITSY